MLLVALIPPPSPPEIAAPAYQGMLGEGWEVRAFREQGEVPDDVAAEAEFLMPAASQGVDASLLSRMPRLRMVQVPGHGYDHVSLADAAAAGVPVCSVASSGAEAHTVAEMAILLAGVASRQIVKGHDLVRGGGWGAQALLLTGGVLELAGKTMGLVGLGRIGREAAKRARAFDMRVLYHDVVRPPAEEEASLGIEFRELDDLLKESDVVSLHAPLTRATRGLIDERALSLMRGNAVLVNTSRGALVDAAALADALKAGRIRAAALDVFETEPPPPDSPLVGLDNVILSPHMGGVTGESVLRILGAAIENVRRVSRDEEPLDVIEDPDLG
ncbi:MAG: NAD(P)-dependent oxidoreductase [Actinomycetota bacterium]